MQDAYYTSPVAILTCYLQSYSDALLGAIKLHSDIALCCYLIQDLIYFASETSNVKTNIKLRVEAGNFNLLALLREFEVLRGLNCLPEC